MKKSNFEVIQSLKIVLRRVHRLAEGFRLEKEEALQSPGTEGLEDLRRRSRVHYRIRLADCSREVLRLQRRISSDLPAREEAEDMAETCRREVAELDAHLVSAPNRLIRARGEEPREDLR
ncbi:MAG: hypothetical protein R6U39_08150 [Candidatus Aegiribacteria sp.]